MQSLRPRPLPAVTNLCLLQSYVYHPSDRSSSHVQAGSHDRLGQQVRYDVVNGMQQPLPLARAVCLPCRHSISSGGRVAYNQTEHVYDETDECNDEQLPLLCVLRRIGSLVPVRMRRTYPYMCDPGGRKSRTIGVHDNLSYSQDLRYKLGMMRRYRRIVIRIHAYYCCLYACGPWGRRSPAWTTAALFLSSSWQKGGDADERPTPPRRAPGTYAVRSSVIAATPSHRLPAGQNWTGRAGGMALACASRSQ